MTKKEINDIEVEYEVLGVKTTEDFNMIDFANETLKNIYQPLKKD